MPLDDSRDVRKDSHRFFVSQLRVIGMRLQTADDQESALHEDDAPPRKSLHDFAGGENFWHDDDIGRDRFERFVIEITDRNVDLEPVGTKRRFVMECARVIARLTQDSHVLVDHSIAPALGRVVGDEVKDLHAVSA